MPYCALLDNHLCKRVNGGIVPCCVNTMKDRNFQSWDELKNSFQYLDIVEEMKDGWHETCKKCEFNEKQGDTSYRQWANGEVKKGHWIHGKLSHIEMSLSNQCNFACRMCGPISSTTWGKLIIDNAQEIELHEKKWYLGPLNDAPSRHYRMENLKVNTKRIENLRLTNHKKNLKTMRDLLDPHDLSNLKFFKMLGGEPFLSAEIDMMFDYLKERGVDLSKMGFTCNTNASLFPKASIRELLKELEYVNIMFSLDGIGKSLEYSREGANWQTIKDNIWKWHDFQKTWDDGPMPGQLRFAVHCVVNVWSLSALDDLEKWSKCMGFKIHYDFAAESSPEQTVNALPPAYINTLKIPKEIHFDEYYRFDSSSFEKLKSATELWDKVTGKHMKDYLPYLADYVYGNNTSTP